MFDKVGNYKQYIAIDNEHMFQTVIHNYDTQCDYTPKIRNELDKFSEDQLNHII